MKSTAIMVGVVQHALAVHSHYVYSLVPSVLHIAMVTFICAEAFMFCSSKSSSEWIWLLTQILIQSSQCFICALTRV